MTCILKPFNYYFTKQFIMKFNLSFHPFYYFRTKDILWDEENTF